MTDTPNQTVKPEDRRMGSTRESSELGMLELLSLRINKALLEVTGNEHWNQKRPVIRIAKKQGVDRENTTHAIWHRITGVAGEEFDNR
jgi:hypothetical protein